MRHTFAIAAAGAVLAASPAAAQGTPTAACSQRDAMIRHLNVQYGETLAAGGIRDSQSILEVWISEDRGTWTLLLTQANGLSCIVAAGTDWRGSLQAAKGTPS